VNEASTRPGCGARRSFIGDDEPERARSNERTDLHRTLQDHAVDARAKRAVTALAWDASFEDVKRRRPATLDRVGCAKD